jgi:hypothetical protein
MLQCRPDLAAISSASMAALRHGCPIVAEAPQKALFGVCFPHCPLPRLASVVPPVLAGPFRMSVGLANVALLDAGSLIDFGT